MSKFENAKRKVTLSRFLDNGNCIKCCLKANLFGRFGSSNLDEEGVVFRNFGGWENTLSMLKMDIRPAGFDREIASPEIFH